MLSILYSTSSILQMLWYNSVVVAEKTQCVKGLYFSATCKLLILPLGPPFARILLAALPLRPSVPGNKFYPGRAEYSSGYDS